MVLKNIGEDTAQNPPWLLSDGAGREVGFLAEGDNQHKTPYRAWLVQLVERWYRKP